MKENNSKLEQIKQLFNEGIISVDELISISSRLKSNTSEDSENCNNLSRYFVTDYLAKDSIKKFPVKQVVDFMHQVNWKWALEEVTVESFKKQIYELVEETVKQMFDYVVAHNTTPLKYIKEDFGVATGGIEVIGYFDEEGYPEIEVRFVAAATFSSYTQNDFRVIALNEYVDKE